MEKTEVFNKEYSYIKNDRYKKIAKELVSLLPDYFFRVAASSTGKYHPSFSLGDGGRAQRHQARGHQRQQDVCQRQARKPF